MNATVSVLDNDAMKSDVKRPGGGNMVDKLKRFPEMDEGQFEQWTALLEERTGMRLPDNRRSFLVTNLGIRMRELGFSSYEDYFQHLHSGRSGIIEWDKLVHYLTVHETRFIRHQESLDLIRDRYLPRTPKDCIRLPLTIHVWSVGCSTGEEPYSIAMVIEDHLSRLGVEYYLGVIASDISRNAISVGRAGIYNAEQIKHLDGAWIEKYFEKLPDGRYQVSPDLRQRVCFNQVNVVNLGKTPIGAMDIIICQNLLIYYDKQRRIDIVNQFVNHLTPGGLLVLGVGELINWSHPNMERLHYTNTLAYRHK